MSTKPRRIQLRRTKGWRMPENTIVVARPSPWGNPFKVVREQQRARGNRWRTSYAIWNVLEDVCINTGIQHRDTATRLAIEQYERWIVSLEEEIRTEFRGRNLACWCALDKPCHADVLLKIANEAKPVVGRAR